MREGEAEKQVNFHFLVIYYNGCNRPKMAHFCLFYLVQKQYAALVWISRSLEDDDLKTLSSVMDMVSWYCLLCLSLPLCTLLCSCVCAF